MADLPAGFKSIPAPTDLPSGFSSAAEPAPRGQGDTILPQSAEGIQRGILGAGQPAPLDKIQKVGDFLAPHLLAAPAETILTGGGGTLATKALPQIPKLAAAGGRALTAGAIGGLEAGSVGRGAVDTGIAGLFEAALSGVTHAKIPRLTKSFADVAEKVANRGKMHDVGRAGIDAAFDAIASRLPAPGVKWLYVPALSAKKMSTEEAREAFKKTIGDRAKYEAARRQIFEELKTLDKRAAKAPSIGQNLYTAPEFKAHTLKESFTVPTKAREKFAQGVVGALESPATRAVGDVAATQDVAGVPAGAIPLLMRGEGGGSLRHLAERLMLHR